MQSSVLQLVGLRSEYAVLPRSTAVSVTGAHQIGVAFSGHRAMVREVDGRTERVGTPPGVVYVTADRPIRWLEVHEPVEALEVYLDPALLVAAGGSSVEPATGISDSVMLAVGVRLRRAHLSAVPVTDLESDVLAHQLASHVARRYAGAREETPGPLRRVDLDTVGALVDAHIAEAIPLAALAASVAVSPFHFARSFKQTTGLTPHAYVTSVRLTRAKDRLLRSQDSVAAVAQAVGLTNVGHFRRLFRREFGVQPGDLRRGA
jgi:AraC family transcriptional regulator